ncbi:MAG: hypothetical protein EXS05_13905 [Planctomycetaceae bacterium]|nr:hypothetical protein [Planctomycetaceae bacterium]
MIRTLSLPAGVRLCLAVGIGLAAGHTACAQDRVVLRRGALSGRITVTGSIENYTGDEIAIRTPQGDVVRKYPAADVVSISTPQSEIHDRALELLHENRLAEAQRAFDAALKQEPRVWVRREILSMMVRCSLRQGDYAAAGMRFLALLKSDPITRHFRLVPLVWASESLSATARSEGQTWLAASDEAARLIGASLLLDDPALAGKARTALRELSTSTDSRIRSLAQIQGWRRDLSAGGLGELQIAHWQQRVDELPSDLRAGPSYLLGRAYALRHDHEMAAATLLWLPLVDDHDFRLAARACLEAGQSLEQIGQQAEALALYQEVTQRFAATPFADEAQTLLQAAVAKDAARNEKGLKN